MGECNGCGDCCDPVLLMQSAEGAIAEIDEGKLKVMPKTEAWMRQLKPVDFEDGCRRRLMLTEEAGPFFFYECGHFDPVTRQCTVHDDPEVFPDDVCAGYPWYGRPPNEEDIFLDPRCSYVEDTKEFIAFVPACGLKIR